jgi:hypothetical protein
MSGLQVLIGLNSPRISADALGFMSKVSNWLGEPRVENHDARFFIVSRRHRAHRLQRRSFESVSPIAPSDPTCRKSRRVILSQVVIEPLPVALSIAAQFHVWFVQNTLLSKPKYARNHLFVNVKSQLSPFLKTRYG